MAERSKHQEKIIRNYYQNREAIAAQRVQELVTELYLAEGKARQRHWKTLATHLAALGVQDEQIRHLQEQDKPELVLSLLNDLLSKNKK